MISDLDYINIIRVENLGKAEDGDLSKSERRMAKTIDALIEMLDRWATRMAVQDTLEKARSVNIHLYTTDLSEGEVES